MTIPLLTVNPDTIKEVTALLKLCLKDDLLAPVPFEELNKFSQHTISMFCVLYPAYQFPTTELIEFLKSEIDDKSAIEIGSGNGSVGRALGIPLTDNRMQEWPSIKQEYNNMRQATISYPDDIEKLPADKAVVKYKPDVVVACWVTQLIKTFADIGRGNPHGVNERELLKSGIKKYIHVGNENVHADKKILKLYKHRALKFPWLVSRSPDRDKNIIYIFDL